MADLIPSALPHLPHVNAVLNTTSALALAVGWGFIRRGWVGAHRACMLAAAGASALFLASYLLYHAQVGSVRYEGQGWMRVLYLGILASHTVLAALVAPMIALTLWRALRRQFDRHRSLAQWVLPVWLYVAVTGVAVYLLLYRTG